jgi:membrane-associated protein
VAPLVDALLREQGLVAYALVGLLVFLETAVFIGVFFPGETAVVVGGVLASEGRVSLWTMVVVVVAAAVVGDLAGYGIGRLFGHRVMRLGLLRRHRRRIEEGATYLRTHGAWAVVAGRFLAFLRTFVPTLAGFSRMRIRVFILADLIGGLVWGTGYLLLGNLVGATWSRVHGTVGRILLAATIAVVLAGVVLVRRRHHRSAPPGKA